MLEDIGLTFKRSKTKVKATKALLLSKACIKKLTWNQRWRLVIVSTGTNTIASGTLTVID
jgi:hypothetical protein